MTEHVDQALLALRLSILDLQDAREDAATADYLISEASKIAECASQLNLLSLELLAAKHKQAAE